MAYSWQILIDGEDAAGITLAGASISYGRNTVWEQPRPGYCYLQLLTPDAVPSIADDYPDLAPGAFGAKSGFSDSYVDNYYGVVSKLVVGAPVKVIASTPTGFTDAYVDDYGNGDTLTRFTGRISAIDYEPGEAAVTVVDASEALTRFDLPTWQRPGETDHYRVQAIAKAAGVIIQIDGQDTTNLLPDDQPQTTTAWAALQKIAQDCGAVVYVDRDGLIHYSCWDDKGQPRIIPGETVIVQSLQMQSELGSIVNTVIVDYGAKDDQGKQPTVTVTDPDSITAYGVIDRKFTTRLADEADAQTMAGQIVKQAARPAWNMPTATVTFYGASDPTISAVAPLEVQDIAQIGPLPQAAPFLDYQALVLGYTERLDQNDWQMTLHLSPQEYVP